MLYFKAIEMCLWHAEPHTYSEVVVNM